MKLEPESPEASPHPDESAASPARNRLPAGRDAVRKLKGEIRLLREELQSLYSSPAWRLVSVYRRWLRRTEERWPGVYRLYASLANRFALRFVDAQPAAGTDSTITALYHEWIQETEPSAIELELQREHASQLPYQPLISVLLPVFRVPLWVLRAAVDSVCSQTYPNWELCLAHGDPDDAEARDYLLRLSRSEPRITVRLLDSNLGISGNTNAALSMATGEFVALLDHDDTLAPFALFEVACFLNGRRELNFIYSDSDMLDDGGQCRFRPYFKPGWSRNLILSVNYVTHLCVIRSQIAREVGGFRPEFDGAQDWDFFLRVAADGSRVAHIAKVLYHWRRGPTSVASLGFTVKPYAAEAQMRTLASHFAAEGKAVEPSLVRTDTVHLRWASEEKLSVSVVIVSAGFSARAALLAERLARRAGPDLLEIVVPVRGRAPGTSSRVGVVEIEESQSTAEALNRAAAKCRGDVIVFLDQTVTCPEGWLKEITGPLQDRATGAVGAKLLDSRSSRIRHAGIVFNSDGEARNLFSGMEEGGEEPFGSDRWSRDVLAVSGACFSVRRDVFLRVGGFHAVPLYPRLDIDLCLRLRLEEGLGIVSNPYARMTQNGPALLESWLSRGAEQQGRERFEALFPDGDPFFNPNLEQTEGSIQFRTPRIIGPSSAAEMEVWPDSALAAFDFTQVELAESRAACARPGLGVVKKLTWFLPGIPYAFYGGAHTILRFADFFRRAHGVGSTFVLPPPAEGSVIRGRIAEAFPDLASASQILVLEGPSRLLELESSDAGIATLWSTAYDLLRFNNVRRKFYFVQDDESLFYPAGSTSAYAEATCRFGFAGICNSIGVRDRYVTRGGTAEYFDPCIDTSVFNLDGRESEPGARDVSTLFCYMRPSHPRNCFELMADALRLVKSRLGKRVRILSAGADWGPKSYGLEGVLENLGLLGYRQTASLYRKCDAGLVMMMTCHPSYLPLELMACGALVISNRNPHTGWLLQDRVNCFLSEASPSSIADAVEEGLEDRELRERLTRESHRLILERYSQWDEQAEKIYRYICSQS